MVRPAPQTAARRLSTAPLVRSIRGAPGQKATVRSQQSPQCQPPAPSRRRGKVDSDLAIADLDSLRLGQRSVGADTGRDVEVREPRDPIDATLKTRQQDYQIIQAAIDEALLMCQYGVMAYEHADPEVRRQLLQAAFDKIWVMGVEIVGCDLKPGYVTLLDEELVTELEWQSRRSRGEEDERSAPTRMHYRRVTRPARRPAPVATMSKDIEDDDWHSPERPGGRLPWEAKNTKQLVGVSSSNVDTLVGATGFEPVALGCKATNRWWSRSR
jgi:hypothetical protein